MGYMMIKENNHIDDSPIYIVTIKHMEYNIVYHTKDLDDAKRWASKMEVKLRKEEENIELLVMSLKEWYLLYSKDQNDNNK